MSTVEKKKAYSVEEYFALELKNEYKSEYYDGEIFAMSGGTYNHSKIAANTLRFTANHLEGKDCDVFGSDMAVHIAAANAYVYPDLSVSCGPYEHTQGPKQALLNPKLIVEVLSKTTEGFDRGGKFQKYQSIESLQEYVLIDQWQERVEVYRRVPGGLWEYKAYSGPDAEVRLDSLGIALAMKDIYHRITFEPK